MNASSMVEKPQVSFAVAGVDALLMQFTQQMNPCMPGFLASLRARILAEHGDVVAEVVPAYGSLLVYYEPRLVRTYDLQQLLEQLAAETPWLCSPWSLDNTAPGKLVEVPVYYYAAEQESANSNASTVAGDMAKVCAATGLSQAEVVALHTSTEYQVYALGFAPGFAYLGQLPEALQIPRLAQPRLEIPAGSVAIAGLQTAVYPCSSPGGWHVLGRSPFVWFNAEQEPMTPVQVGDRIRFVAISAEEYQQLLATGGEA